MKKRTIYNYINANHEVFCIKYTVLVNIKKRKLNKKGKYKIIGLSVFKNLQKKGMSNLPTSIREHALDRFDPRIDDTLETENSQER